MTGLPPKLTAIGVAALGVGGALLINLPLPVLCSARYLPA